MTKTLRHDFQRMLETGGYSSPPGRAVCALHAARTLEEWRVAERAGLVRLQAKPKQESYFDVYGEPDSERERKSIERELEATGCWIVYSQVMTSDGWDIVDSIGMNTGYDDPLDPFQNGYVVDLMTSALRAIDVSGGALIILFMPLNSLETYTDAGRRAAKALRQRDMGTYQHWTGWVSKALNLETLKDRPAAEQAYRNGYKENFDPTPHYFR